MSGDGLVFIEREKRVFCAKSRERERQKMPSLVPLLLIKIRIISR